MNIILIDTEKCLPKIVSITKSIIYPLSFIFYANFAFINSSLIYSLSPLYIALYPFSLYVWIHFDYRFHFLKRENKEKNIGYICCCCFCFNFRYVYFQYCFVPLKTDLFLVGGGGGVVAVILLAFIQFLVVAFNVFA